jgi:hypothetical protein
MGQRDFYIDRLRTVMTAFVVLYHTTIIFSASRGWSYSEIHSSDPLLDRLVRLLVYTNMAYLMGFFFLLAGYFTPASLERKGYARFLRDRFVRLGLPLLAFCLLLGPLTAALQSFAQGNGFWITIGLIWRQKQFINGPLWFAQALLIFSLVYCAWRAIAGSPLSRTERVPAPVPAHRWWFLSAIGIGALTLGIRQFVPVTKLVCGLRLGYFASYIFLFAVGIAAWRYDWLRQLTWKNARMGIIGAVVAWPLMPFSAAIAHLLRHPGVFNFARFNWPSVLYAFWDPFLAWGFIAMGILIFRSHVNQPSPIWDWFTQRAYAVYIINAPVLAGIAVLLHGWVVSELVRYSVAGTLGCVATWLLADPLVRVLGGRRLAQSLAG